MTWVLELRCDDCDALIDTLREGPRARTRLLALARRAGAFVLRSGGRRRVYCAECGGAIFASKGAR